MPITPSRELTFALLSLASGRDGTAFSEEETQQLDTFLRSYAKDVYFERWTPSSSPLNLNQTAPLADCIIEGRRQGKTGEFALLASQRLIANDLEEEVYELVAAIIADLSDHEIFANLSPIEEDHLTEELLWRLADILSEEDQSSVADIFSAHDHTEVVFMFTPNPGELESMIWSNRPWADFSDLVVDDTLAHGLSCLGYTTSDYRAASGNRNPSRPRRGSIRLQNPPFKRPSPPLCSMEKVKEMVENACSNAFLFCLYAIVPVRALLDLNPNQALHFSKAAIATYNPFSGTFHEACFAQSVTVTPAMGRLFSPHGWYTPDDICGFSTRHFHAELTNPQPGEPEDLPLAA